MHTNSKHLSLTFLTTIVTLFFSYSFAFADIYPKLVNVAPDGTIGNNIARGFSINSDGRYVAFVSSATNLVPNDANGFDDVFVRDMVTGAIKIASVSSDGTQENNFGMCQPNGYPSISPDGRYVAFCSKSSNLVPNDTNGVADFFVHDMLTGSTTRVSVASDGTPGNDMSITPPESSVYFSADDRYVVFDSVASNLVSNDTNRSFNVYVHDMFTGSTTRVNVASDGTEASQGSGSASLSGDGRYITFSSTATNLDPGGVSGIFVHDTVSGTTTLIGPQGVYSYISENGRYILFSSFASNLVPNDTNGVADFFVHDMLTGSTTRVSVASDGTESNGVSVNFGSISQDGRYITFQSNASNLDPNAPNTNIKTFVHDMVTGITALIADNSITAVISADGQYISYYSANNLFLTLNPLFPTNHTPTLTAIGNKVVNEGQTLSFTVNATDPDAGDMLTYAATNLPPGATFDPSTHTFTWTPDYTQAGNYPDVEFAVSDNGSPMKLDLEDITITVGDVNRAPVISNPGPQQVLEHNTLTFTVNATDPDGDAVTLSAIDVPAGATFDSSTGVFSWTPGYPTAGVYTPTFIATDNGSPTASSSIDVVITVGSNPTPTEQDQTLINTVMGYNLPTNVTNQYLQNLDKAEQYIQAGRTDKAISELNKFIDKVNSDYSHGTITQVERDQMVATAQSLINSLQ